MCTAFLFRGVRFILVIGILSSLLLSSIPVADAQPRFKLVIGDFPADGSQLPPRLIDEGLRPENAKNMKPEERCKLTEAACKTYADEMHTRCKRLQSADWEDGENCDVMKPKHFAYCMVEYSCPK